MAAPDDPGDRGSASTEVRTLNLLDDEPDVVPDTANTTPRVKDVRKIEPDDWTRIALAAGLVGLLVLLTVGAGIYVALVPAQELAMENYLKLVFTPVLGLVGSVVGFYFGAHSNPKSH